MHGTWGLVQTLLCGLGGGITHMNRLLTYVTWSPASYPQVQHVITPGTRGSHVTHPGQKLCCRLRYALWISEHARMQAMCCSAIWLW